MAALNVNVSGDPELMEAATLIEEDCANETPRHSFPKARFAFATLLLGLLVCLGVMSIHPTDSQQSATDLSRRASTMQAGTEFEAAVGQDYLVDDNQPPTPARGLQAEEENPEEIEKKLHEVVERDGKALSQDDKVTLFNHMNGLVKSIAACANGPCKGPAQANMLSAGMQLAGKALELSEAIQPAGTFLWMVGSLISSLFGAPTGGHQPTVAEMLDEFQKMVRTELASYGVDQAKMQLNAEIKNLQDDIKTLTLVLRNVNGPYKWENVEQGINDDIADVKSAIKKMNIAYDNVRNLLDSIRHTATWASNCKSSQCPPNGDYAWDQNCVTSRDNFVRHVNSQKATLAEITVSFKLMSYFITIMELTFQKFHKGNHFEASTLVEHVRGVTPMYKVAARNLHGIMHDCDSDKSLFAPVCTPTNCNYPEIKLAPPNTLYGRDEWNKPQCYGGSGWKQSGWAKGPGWKYVWMSPGSESPNCCMCQLNLFTHGGGPACFSNVGDRDVCVDMGASWTNFPSNSFRAGHLPWHPTQQKHYLPWAQACEQDSLQGDDGPLAVCARQAVCASGSCRAHFEDSQWPNNDA